MNQMVYNQIFCLLIFIITGIAIGVLFDIFRILRRSFKTADWVTYIQDILFWLLTGAIVLFSIFQFNNGEVRGYLFLGIFLGALLYMLTISRFFIQYSVIIIQALKKVFSIPIKIINHIIFKPICFLVINIQKSITIHGKKNQNMTKLSKKIKKKQVKT